MPAITGGPAQTQSQNVQPLGGTFDSAGNPLAIVGPGGVVVSRPYDPSAVAINRVAGVTNYQALAPFFQAMGDVINSPVLIQYIGDSTVFGLFSDGTSTATDAAQAPNAAATVIPKLVNTQLGTAATFSINGTDSRATVSGGSVSASVGMGGARSISSTGPATITFALPASGSIDIIYYESNGTAGTPTTGGFLYDFGTGAVTGSVVSAGTFDTYKKVTINGTGSAGNLVLTGTSANAAFICQVNTYTTGGVVVGRNGHSGWTLTDILGAGTNNGTNAVGQARLLKGISLGSPALVMLQIGHNDCSLQATAGQLTTPSVYAANIAAVAASLGSTPLLLVSEPDPNLSDSALTFKYRDYWATARGLAVPGSNIAHIAIADFWGSFATAKASGYCNDGSGVHPLRKGYGSIARLLQGVLSGPDVYRSQLLTGQ